MAEERQDGLTRVVIGLVGISIASLLAWVGYTLNTKIPEALTDIKIQQTEIKGEISALSEKAQNIVPRTENERRWISLESGQAQNADRISKLEQYLLNRAAK